MAGIDDHRTASCADVVDPSRESGMVAVVVGEANAIDATVSCEEHHDDVRLHATNTFESLANSIAGGFRSQKKKYVPLVYRPVWSFKKPREIPRVVLGVAEDSLAGSAVHSDHDGDSAQGHKRKCDRRRAHGKPAQTLTLGSGIAQSRVSWGWWPSAWMEEQRQTFGLVRPVHLGRTRLPSAPLELDLLEAELARVEDFVEARQHFLLSDSARHHVKQLVGVIEREQSGPVRL